MTTSKLAIRSDWTPIAPQSGQHLLDWLLWKGAEYLTKQWSEQEELESQEQERLEARGEYYNGIVAVFESTNDAIRVERWDELYTIVAQALGDLGSTIDEATIRLFYQIRQDGTYLLDGWAGITGWALALRERYNRSSGFWWQLGSIVDYVIPFVEAFIPNIPPEQFFDTSYLYKVAIVLPRLVQIINSDDGRGLGYNIKAVESLLLEVDAKTKTALQEGHTAPRILPIPAYYNNPNPNIYRLVIEAADQKSLDRVIRRLKGYIALTLDQPGVESE